MSEKYDHIIVGGGSSGCAAAARLVKEGGARVLLLEAGHSHRHPLLDMPPGIFKMINGSKFMRYHHTVPQEHLNGRVHDIPQRNVLGGELELCGTDPLTGFYRDGWCNTGPEDLGSHTICAVVTAEFLDHQQRIGNDLST